ncbi:MAG: hypothetical protein ACK5LX_07445 [Oscillospiraceae bacterium]
MAANKFTQSVLERLEQEAKAQKQDEKAKMSAPPVATTSKEKDVILSAKPEKKQEVASSAQEKTAQIPDLSLFLQPTTERSAKNKTFYLDTEVIDALHRAAKAQKMTDSRLCNDILRKVLGL